MPTTLSPLRYPGGKTKLYHKVLSILEQNGLQDVVYVEPFCGGCGLAIQLLLRRDVSSIVINDVDPAIFAFWDCVVNKTDELCSRLAECCITVEERDKQVKILQHLDSHSTIDIGFAALFLNRTNISGILSAGPIGGRDQTGKDKLDARFKTEAIMKKIANIAAQKDRISLYNLDAIDFIDRIIHEYEASKVFINFDPPYVKKGQELYVNHFSMEGHKRLRDKICECDHYWIVTYDYNASVLDLYASFHYERIQLNHSAGSMKKGEEVIIYSSNLQKHVLQPDSDTYTVDRLVCGPRFDPPL